jgi:8-oxo-dGTP pyrophosphatase MutT (NUDIX family)
MTRSSEIRPLALGIVRRGDDLLVCEFYDRVKQQTFYRLPGGGIEFGERGREALRREFREEIGMELNSVHYVATIENIFVHEGQPGHEIVLLYETSPADPSFYKRETFEIDEGSEILKARWMSLRAFGAQGSPPLYPAGLLELLTDRNVTL